MRLNPWLAMLLPVALMACSPNQGPPGTSAPILSDSGDGGPSTTVDAPPAMDATTEADSGPLVAIPLTACVPNVYAAAMTIGGSQQVELIFDTGSTSLGVAAVGCASCADAGVSTLYQPGPTAVDQHMTADASFGALAPSGFSGEIYEDWVGAAASPELAKVNLVAITEQTEFLVGTCGPGGPPLGVIGFAESPNALPGTNGFFDQVVLRGTIPDVFATRFCSTGGTLWLGGYDPTLTTAPPVYTPMTLTGAGEVGTAVYTVNLASIAVAGTMIPIGTSSFPGTFLDTGSSIWSLPPAALDALGSAIAASPSFSQIFGAAGPSFFTSTSNSVTLTQTKHELDAALPPLTLTFGSNPPVSVQATATESYLLTYGGGAWSPSMTSRTPDNSTFPGIAAILGAPILASNVVIFDRAKQRVGFAPHTACP